MGCCNPHGVHYCTSTSGEGEKAPSSIEAADRRRVSYGWWNRGSYNAPDHSINPFQSHLHSCAATHQL
uniref:Uncharacterized protein n=1 Tax=Picea glauca TaxID=3330 RepID=A0A101LZ36_PICGL|nr:hypothetical protein ABT39_MTgene5014 [Picea glauca]